MVVWLNILALGALLVASYFFEPFGTSTSNAMTIAILALFAALIFETKRQQGERNHSQEGTQK